MEKNEKVVTIKTKTVKTEKTSFKAYKVNIDGKAVDLRFKKESNVNALKILENESDGYFRVVVTDFSASDTSFYPRYYATLVEVLGDDSELD